MILNQQKNASDQKKDKDFQLVNWQNDPLLFDQECTPMNDWLTANKLIELGHEERIFADKESLTLNLYPILVRRIDFVREKESDRILSRFPFLVLTDEEKVLIKSKILLIAEFARDYFYKSINSKIMDWKRRLQTYLKRGAMPFPLYRCACEILDLPLHHFDDEELFFESARGKQYSIPTTLINALAYLSGVINGDGHLKRHWLRITDETKEYMQILSILFEKIFKDPGEIFLTGNAWNAELHSSSVSRIFNFLTDHTIDGAKYDSLREPLLFKQLGEPFRNIYWRGVMDADGSFKNQIAFTSASEKYVLDFQSFLKSININSELKENNDGICGFYLLSKYKLQYVESIGSLNPKKSDDLLDYLQKKRKYSKFNGLKKGILTEEGYFNLDLLDSLFIIGLGDFLKEYRSDRSFTIMDELFDMAQGSYSKMERNRRGLPYFMLKKMIIDYSKGEYTIYDFLVKNYSSIRFQVANSSPIILPMTSGTKLESILPYLEPKINYVNIKETSEHIKTTLKNIFGIEVTTPRINCRLLNHFLETFYDYIDNTPTISIKEFFTFKKQWREEIFS